ncbi:unnamed protein product [Amoebophrya sp. A120]|nr:unnamed protein product [Amoebophrya sp. A120]|eukprot:GSA120T00002602001.1
MFSPSMNHRELSPEEALDKGVLEASKAHQSPCAEKGKIFSHADALGLTASERRLVYRQQELPLEQQEPPSTTDAEQLNTKQPDVGGNKSSGAAGAATGSATAAPRLNAAYLATLKPPCVSMPQPVSQVYLQQLVDHKEREHQLALARDREMVEQALAGRSWEEVALENPVDPLLGSKIAQQYWLDEYGSLHPPVTRTLERKRDQKLQEKLAWQEAQAGWREAQAGLAAESGAKMNAFLGGLSTTNPNANIINQQVPPVPEKENVVNSSFAVGHGPMIHNPLAGRSRPAPYAGGKSDAIVPGARPRNAKELPPTRRHDKLPVLREEERPGEQPVLSEDEEEELLWPPDPKRQSKYQNHIRKYNAPMMIDSPPASPRAGGEFGGNNISSEQRDLLSDDPPARGKDRTKPLLPAVEKNPKPKSGAAATAAAKKKAAAESAKMKPAAPEAEKKAAPAATAKKSTTGAAAKKRAGAETAKKAVTAATTRKTATAKKEPGSTAAVKKATLNAGTSSMKKAATIAETKKKPTGAGAAKKTAAVAQNAKKNGAVEGAAKHKESAEAKTVTNTKAPAGPAPKAKAKVARAAPASTSKSMKKDPQQSAPRSKPVQKQGQKPKAAPKAVMKKENK